MSNEIELKSISELSGMKFFIPDYQRGYRWTKQQVKDLLDDIDEFMNKKQGGFYCIQPLVVKKNILKEEEYCIELKELKPGDEVDLIKATEKILNKYSRWEVIDGQQRLTTIYILLSYMESYYKYEIEYETRVDSKEFLSKIEGSKKKDNIDYYHISEANEQITNWFNEKSDDSKKLFLNTLLKEVKFIWYESVNEDPIKVFTRLNIGKIALTNAELIKALFLNKSNFRNDGYQKIRLQQQEVSSEWDNIEYTLQNDEFWLFLNEANYDKSTRIDFIFDLIWEKNLLELSDYKEDIGTDEYRTFRYFYIWFRRETNIDISICWREVKTLFQTFQEWFNDLELYHNIGFLVEHKTKISSILDEWKQSDRTKDNFLAEFIYPEIKNQLTQCSDLDKQYEVNGSPKTKCRPILLLHNIQTIINQNKSLTENEKYKLPVFYKFPFHLFKKEKWDVEHIDSNVENSLENEKEQKEWLTASLIAITDDELKKDIKSFISDYSEKENNSKNNFEELYSRIIEESTTKLKDEEKDKLWNFTLLDASTNRSYGNSIFPVKRRVIIGKDQGKTITVNDKLEIEEKDGAIAFIPPSTKNVFMKYHNVSPNNLREWNREDAKAYINNIETVLEKFLTTKNDLNAQ